MVERAMTAKQRRAVEALRAAQAAGVSLVGYARANGLAIRELYDGLAALRRRGALPPASAPRRGVSRRARDRFLPVRIVSSAMVATAPAPATGPNPGPAPSAPPAGRTARWMCPPPRAPR